MNDDPIKHCTRLILFQAQQDHASELVVSSSRRFATPVRYKLGHTWHDWQSPGPEHAPAIIDEMGRLAAFSKQPFPRKGLIDLQYSGVRLRWVVRMASADGDCVLTPAEQ
jgi:hypothetical protein